MREILFRGKDIAENWHYGVPLIFTDDYVCMTAPHTYNKAVIPETVGQYTGLTDKTDKNGKKIFEGDIVKHPIGTFVVKFLSGTFCCSLIEDDYLTDICSIHNACEVIGNIHDNPELLKGGTDNGHP